MPNPTIAQIAQQVTDGALRALSQGDDVVIAAHARRRQDRRAQ